MNRCGVLWTSFVISSELQTNIDINELIIFYTIQILRIEISTNRPTNIGVIQIPCNYLFLFRNEGYKRVLHYPFILLFSLERKQNKIFDALQMKSHSKFKHDSTITHPESKR